MIETPFNYTGSKFKLLPQLIPLFDRSKTRFVDLFAGGGSVYTNVVEYYPNILANDIISDLMEIHKKLIFDMEATISNVKSLCVSKEDQIGYHALRDSYNNEPTPEKLFALMLCCTNNMMRFNKKFKFNQTFGRRTFNENTLRKINYFSEYLQPHRDKLEFKSITFYDLECSKNDMVYIDPPYSNTEAGYNAYWETNDDVGLYEYCKKLNASGASLAVSGVESHAGKSCRLIDLLVAEGFKKTSLEFNYNKVSRKGQKETKEVLITNY